MRKLEEKIEVVVQRAIEGKIRKVMLGNGFKGIIVDDIYNILPLINEDKMIDELLNGNPVNIKLRPHIANNKGANEYLIHINNVTARIDRNNNVAEIFFELQNVHIIKT